MRKFILVAVLGAVLGAIWTEDTEACGRRRRACCSSYCVPAPCLTAPRAPRPLHMPALETEAIQTPRGRVHRLHTIDDLGWQEPVRKQPFRPEAVVTRGSGDIFNGHDREAAKTSISMAGNGPFADLAPLASTLPDDGFLRNDPVPPISQAQDARRAQ